MLFGASKPASCYQEPAKRRKLTSTVVKEDVGAPFSDSQQSVTESYHHVVSNKPSKFAAETSSCLPVSQAFSQTTVETPQQLQMSMEGHVASQSPPHAKTLPQYEACPLDPEVSPKSESPP